MIGLRRLLCAGQIAFDDVGIANSHWSEGVTMRWVNLIFAAVVANNLECGGLLFDRSGGRITLTAGGQALLPYTRRS
jgi:hypothetical protein